MQTEDTTGQWNMQVTDATVAEYDTRTLPMGQTPCAGGLAVALAV